MARGAVKGDLKVSWAATAHDGMKLLDGRKIGAIPTTELTTLLVAYAVPGVSAENGRAVNIEAYAAHIAKLRAAGGEEAVQRWIGIVRMNDPAPRALLLETVDGDTFVRGGWPTQALIANALLAAPPPCMVVDGSTITIGAKNGFASYRRRKPLDDAWLCSVGESEYTGPPPITDWP